MIIMPGSSSLCHRCRLHLQIGAVGGGRGCLLPIAACLLPLATQLVALSFWRPLAVALTCCRLRSPRTGARDRRTEQPPARVPDICGMRLQQVQRQQQHGPLTTSRALRLLPAGGGGWRLAASCDPHLSRSVAEFAFQGYVEQVPRQRRLEREREHERERERKRH